MPDRDVARAFVRWVFMRAIFHRGWWLVTSLYLVVVAELSAFELVFLGSAQALTALLFEIPAGVLADTISRKRSIIVAHLLMGTAMLATGLVTAFPALVATQMCWGLAWTFSSGADVAWLTDELDRPERAARILATAVRWEQLGAAFGLIALGALAWTTSLSTAMLTAGASMLLLGAFVAVRFAEQGFQPTSTRRLRTSLSILRRGLALVRGEREILVVFAATLLVNGAAEAFERLFPKRLLDLGLPSTPDPIVWLTALGLVTLAVAALAIRIVEARIDGVDAARRLYVAACLVGVLGLVVLGLAPNDSVGMAGVLLVGGIAMSVTRCVGVIWVNRRASSDVRATVQSFLAQAEYAGEIGLGLALGILAQATSLPIAMLGAAVLIASAGCAVALVRTTTST